MQQSITFKGDPELEESFSFSSSYVFDSSAVVFPDTYDLCYSDDESYIEISLGPTPTHHHADQHLSYFKDDVEFRISFSSNTIPLPPLSDYCDSLITSTTSPSSSTMRFSSSSADTHWDPTPNSLRSSASSNNNDERRMELPRLLHRFVNAFMSSLALRPSSQPAGGAAPSNGFLLVRTRTRKATNISSINSGGIMKFFVKLRSLNIGRLLASLSKKAYRSQVKANLRCQKQMKPFDRWAVGVAKSHGSERSKTVLDINLEAIKGVLVAMGASLGRKDNKVKSSRRAKSSPNRNTNYKTCAPDNSIQAAIAHCKSSFSPN